MNALQVVHENFGIEEGLMTTVHATTATQVGTYACCSSGSLCWLHLLLEGSSTSVLAAHPAHSSSLCWLYLMLCALGPTSVLQSCAPICPSQQPPLPAGWP